MSKVDGWLAESELAMHGWDFSHLDGRWENQELPWCYRELIKEQMHDDKMWLDVDTGGGELMSSFHHPAAKTVVTEGWPPNLKLLQEKFIDSAITVIADLNEDLSNVPDDTFDIITNSHGALPVQETVNKLRAGGFFVTQQVGGTNNFSLSRFLDSTYELAYPDNTLINVAIQLQGAGMQIQKQEMAFTRMSFFDVGAIVYYATVIPWEFPKFKVHDCLPQLKQLDKLIATQGSISTFEDRFMIVARKI